MTAVSACVAYHTGSIMGRRELSGGPYWFAVYTKPRAEELADANLRRQGFMTFYPFLRIRQRVRIPRTDKYRVEWVDKPYFQSYIFVAVRFEDESLYTVDDTDGVAAAFRPGKRPMFIPHPVMDALMNLGDKRGEMPPADKAQIREGAKFVIAEGHPFAGFVAQITSLAKLDSSGQIKAFLDVLGGKREVSLPAWVVAEIIA